ncbi:MAG: SDR family NAD(P)-dependent oxidoreductase [Janthinobacterium lividum]
MTASATNSGIAQRFRLDGRTALVTGASKGLGQAMAEALAEQGARVVLVARTTSELDAVAARIIEKGGQAVVRTCDVTRSAAIRAVIAELEELDILVNNAGSNIPEPIEEVTDEHLDYLLDLNTRAYFVVAQAAVTKMKQHPQRLARGASIINIASQMGHIGSESRTVYCMTKHAVVGLTRAMAIELAATGIRVNSIGPTFIDTPLVRRVVNTPEKYSTLVSRIPMGRMGTVDDIAAAAVYLASPASGMVTGAGLLVDGGWTAQ